MCRYRIQYKLGYEYLDSQSYVEKWTFGIEFRTFRSVHTSVETQVQNLPGPPQLWARRAGPLHTSPGSLVVERADAI